MPLLELYQVLREKSRDQRTAYQANQAKLTHRLLDVFLRTWDLGFTAFGGPNVHFQIFYHRFVEGTGGKAPWVDEQTYQELFAICQGLPGPGSTKMLFCLVLLHAGVFPAVFVFLTWSLPGAIGMYALSLGVQRINEILPDPVYALLAGLNSSTVGIIALAAVQLSDKAIKNRILRILVIFGACAGLCYNALWYFPVLMLAGGLTLMIWDVWLRQKVDKFRAKLKRGKSDPQTLAEESNAGPNNELESKLHEQSAKVPEDTSDSGLQRRNVSPNSLPVPSGNPDVISATEEQPQTPSAKEQADAPNFKEAKAATDTVTHAISVRIGIAIIVCFFATFIAVMVLRGVLVHPPLALSLFANMYLAGTIIFGGGPVVIPLLREYVVQPGWVSGRDFLIGLAIIQAFPGPNFNFAVFLGALSLLSSPHPQPTVLGAVLAFLGIFIPGLTLAVGVQSIWRVLRTKPYVVSMLRGVNATAVGLVFTAVYRLWEIGYLSKDASSGQSLGRNPWWLVIASLTYAESAWFGVPPAVSILAGAVLGLIWYGAVGRK